MLKYRYFGKNILFRLKLSFNIKEGSGSSSESGSVLSFNALSYSELELKSQQCLSTFTFSLEGWISLQLHKIWKHDCYVFHFLLWILNHVVFGYIVIFFSELFSSLKVQRNQIMAQMLMLVRYLNYYTGI